VATLLRERPYEVANGTAGLFAMACVIPVWRRLGVGLAAFVFLDTIIPLTVGGLPALGRYTSVLFPIFLWMASSGRSHRGLLIAWAALQCVLAALFFTFRDIF